MPDFSLGEEAWGEGDEDKALFRCWRHFSPSFFASLVKGYLSKMIKHRCDVSYLKSECAGMNLNVPQGPTSAYEFSSPMPFVYYIHDLSLATYVKHDQLEGRRPSHPLYSNIAHYFMPLSIFLYFFSNYLKWNEKKNKRSSVSLRERNVMQEGLTAVPTCILMASPCQYNKWPAHKTLIWMRMMSRKKLYNARIHQHLLPHFWKWGQIMHHYNSSLIYYYAHSKKTKQTVPLYTSHCSHLFQRVLCNTSQWRNFKKRFK